MADLVKTFLKPRRARQARGFSNLGFSIPGAAHELNIAEGTFRRAVKNGEVRTVRFGGRERVSVSEVKRIRAMFDGLEK